MSKGGRPLPLAAADHMAERIAAELAPYCDRVEIAGSIRRRRSIVGDIDLVCLPRDPIALRARILRTQPTVLVDGPQQLEVLLGDVRLDVWIAQPPERDLFTGEKPTNFGSLFLCRTGSTAHNIRLVEHAKTLGLRWNPYWGVYRHETPIASATEEEIFDALQLPFTPPTERQ